MSWWRKLLRMKPSAEETAEMQRLESLMQTVMQDVYNLTPLKWKPHGTGGVSVDTGIRTPGCGEFGYVSLTCEITPQNSRFNGFVRATCLPLSTETNDLYDSMDEAKKECLTKMATQAFILVSNPVVNKQE